MKIKNVVFFDNGFIDSLLFFSKLHLPIKISYPLEKCLKIFQSEEINVKSARDDLVRKYGDIVKNSEGIPIQWDISKASIDNKDKYVKEFNDLIDLDFDIPIEDKLKLSIKEIENEKCSSDFLSKIKLLIEFIE